MTFFWPYMKQRGRISKVASSRWLAVLLLLLFWLRITHTALVKSDTFDEMFHIMYGVLYWQHTPLEPVVQNPPLVSALIGLPASLIFQPTLPLDHPLWPSGNWLRITQAFLWQINDNGLQLLWAGRLVTMSLALGLAALLYRWSGQLFRNRTTGLLVLFLGTFDPNILAHSSLATADIGMTFFLCLAAYLVWRYWHLAKKNNSHTWPLRAYLFAAAGIGCALASKFSGLIILPGLGLIAGYRWLLLFRNLAGLKRAAAELTGWLLLAGLLFLLIYRFDLTALATDFRRQQEHQLTGHSSYLWGELSLEGWWYYFPIVFAFKTPLPVLALFAGAIILFINRGRANWQLLWPLLLAGGMGGASLASRVNIGYRYLLPALPLLYLVVGQWIEQLAMGNRQIPVPHRKNKTSYILSPTLILLIFVFWAASESLLIHPNYLAYFNQLAGGPQNGWRVVVDSNIDWGQDIKPLARYLADNGITEPIQAAWLGTAPLEVYGIQGNPLPAWPVASEEMLYSPFYPPRPAPGLYVLSVTQLQGVYLSDPSRFAWFQEQTPSDKVGYSLFVYDVLADGPPVAVALSGVGLATIKVTDFDQTIASNDTRPRWYDARYAYLWPGGTADSIGSWAVIGEGHLPATSWLQTLYPAPTIFGQSEKGFHYQIFFWPDSPIQSVIAGNAAANTVYTDFGYSLEPVVGANEWNTHRQILTTHPIFAETFQLLGYETNGELSGESLAVMSYWRIEQGIDNNQWDDLKIFLHLLNEEGEVVAQHDGLNVTLNGLQTGDELAQYHQLPLPEDLPPGSYALQIGLYEPISNSRLPITTPIGNVDRILLHQLSINSP